MRRVTNLNDLPLAQVQAHGGEGTILYHRVLAGEELAGAWNFVDYAVLPPGSSIGRHTHGDDEELYLVLEGEGTMHLDGTDFRVRPGSVILNGARGTHGLRNDSPGPIRIFVVEVGLRGAGS